MWKPYINGMAWSGSFNIQPFPNTITPLHLEGCCRIVNVETIHKWHRGVARRILALPKYHPPSTCKANCCQIVNVRTSYINGITCDDSSNIQPFPNTITPLHLELVLSDRECGNHT
ncbi:hypothetical protein AVEN_253272-1 [Araneus ventricosus]|uniref:Uncharacterized protein n=1 Tax=Araneus ventricosus TaxID=182803 RepID=A0A4Y2SJL4_ARAVE|nr:hypothetical protein AVEN_253272-1 [Araneus ventricosus]